MSNQTEIKYHKIPIEEILPYTDRKLERTIYLLGSPGAGKTKFMSRLRDETNGTLVIESGVFDLFQKYAIDFVKRKRKAGCNTDINDFFIRDDSELGYSRDPDFQFPEIDGLNIWNCIMTSVPLDKTLEEYAKGRREEEVCRNLPYSGLGAYHYRLCLGGRIVSGGKSGFPDWLFVPLADKKYLQVISFPGHNKIVDFSTNKSIPKIPSPDFALFLVDPNINQFERTGKAKGYGNDAIKQVHIHLKEALELEKIGLNVNWFLSKTQSAQLKEKRDQAIKHYSSTDIEQDLSEIVMRVPHLPGFDSYKSSSEEILKILEQ